MRDTGKREVCFHRSMQYKVHNEWFFIGQCNLGRGVFKVCSVILKTKAFLAPKIVFLLLHCGKYTHVSFLGGGKGFDSLYNLTGFTRLAELTNF